MAFFDTVAIVGVGLMGGSIGLALRKERMARHVIGIGRRIEQLRQAENRGAVTEATTDLRQGVATANLVVVCTPVDLVPEYVAAAAKACKPETIITDVGSTKAAIVAACDKALADSKGLWASFVGSHPLAGRERTGVEFAREDLFQGRTTVITPTEETREEAAAKVEAFWQGLGSKVVRMTPAEHDISIAATSHLPHLVASALAAATPADLLTLTASGWADTTRIASGDIELWRQIFLDNRVNTLKALTPFETVLSELRQALESADGAALARLLQQGKRIRDTVGS
ncbi:MAG: prephenate dehydrogenase/arogenate dehydrogenase family protein [Pirellulaceae bacterium]|nr:prephenate dehydrogenase/arogenate dehydrogenase family protein [Pirellulaceae bacterium]